MTQKFKIKVNRSLDWWCTDQKN